jgi:hypothetical protein
MCSPSFANFSLSPKRERSADRRSGAAAPVSRASDVGPQALARRLASFRMLASRRSTAAIFGFRTLAKREALRLRHSRGDPPRAPLIVTAVFRSPPGVACIGNAQDAGPDLLMQCLATSTLCGRDLRNIVSGKPQSNDCSAMNRKAVGSLLMGATRRLKLCSEYRPLSTQLASTGMLCCQCRAVCRNTKYFRCNLVVDACNLLGYSIA